MNTRWEKLFKEFKEFISRGNVIDLAVGVIIGGAFTAIVTSLVDDVLTPVLGIIVGGLDFSGLSFTIGEAVIKYGAFIQAIINFLLVAFCVFLLVKAINVFRRNKDAEEKKKETPVEEESQEVKLLTEIRDALKNQK